MVHINYLEERRYWENFYRKYFNLEVDFSDCFAEKNSKKSILESPIFISKEITYPWLFAEGSKILEFSNKEKILDELLSWKLEDPDKDYATWLYYFNYPYNGGDLNPTLSIHLKTLIIFEMHYLLLNKKPFHENGKVFASNSYCERKEASPGVYWENGRLNIKLYKLGTAYADCGFREEATYNKF